MESEPMFTPSEKSPLPKVQRIEPATLRHAGQRTEHITNWTIPAPDLGSIPAILVGHFPDRLVPMMQNWYFGGCLAGRLAS